MLLVLRVLNSFIYVSGYLKSDVKCGVTCRVISVTFLRKLIMEKELEI